MFQFHLNLLTNKQVSIKYWKIVNIIMKDYVSSF